MYVHFVRSSLIRLRPDTRRSAAPSCRGGQRMGVGVIQYSPIPDCATIMVLVWSAILPYKNRFNCRTLTGCLVMRQICPTLGHIGMLGPLRWFDGARHTLSLRAVRSAGYRRTLRSNPPLRTISEKDSDLRRIGEIPPNGHVNKQICVLPTGYTGGRIFYSISPLNKKILG